MKQKGAKFLNTLRRNLPIRRFYSLIGFVLRILQILKKIKFKAMDAPAEINTLLK